VPPDEAEVIKKVLAGDRILFGRLVERYQDRVYSLAMRILRDPHLAEDVAQEAFVRAFQRLAQFRGDSAFSTWLYRIAVNTCWEYLRKSSRMVRWDAPGGEEDDGARLVVGTALSVEERAVKAEQKALLWRAVEKLPDDYRVAVVLRYVDDLSYQEMAQILGVPVATVGTRLHRARTMLAKMLTGVWPGETDDRALP